MKKAFYIGIASAFFFSFTFILNKKMNIAGGSFIWSASLRYLFMFPILFILICIKNQLQPVIKNMKENLFQWIIWSTVGFGVFYSLISLASDYSPSWIVASTWQITIIAGALLSPLFFTVIEGKKVRNKIPKKSLLMSLIILFGVFLIQFQQADTVNPLNILMGVSFILIAAFAYPLGNRKMMEICNDELNTLQRVFGMTLASLPFWIILSTIGVTTVGLPSSDQIFQSLMVAIFSGVIGTLLFFKATNLVRHNPHQLAIIESTQAGEIIFTILGEIIILHDQFPTGLGLVGLILVILGMIVSSFVSTS